MQRRDLIRWGMAAGLAAPSAWASALAAEPPALAERDALDLARQMGQGQLDVQALLAACLQRIDTLDRAGPALRSILCVHPKAGELAAKLDRERKAGKAAGLLHGLPLVIKDSIATSDGMPTTAGSLALEGVRGRRDAALVQRLRAHGALILGKSNLSEWCNLRSFNSTAGWSAVGGLTRNPHALDRVCGGSSSGSAAAVAAGLVPLAVGTETDGSIVCPASICGVVGIKPTVGMVSQAGMFTISTIQDTAGPLARTVRDAALLLEAMAEPERAPRGLWQQLERGALRGKRLGIATEYVVRDRATRAVFEQALARLKELGAVVVEVDIPNRHRYGESSWKLMAHGVTTHLPLWLADYLPDAPIRNLRDLVAFNKQHAARELGLFGQETLEKLQGRAPMDEADHARAVANCRRFAGEEGIDAVLRAERLDALIAPTSIPGWPSDPARRPKRDGGFTSPAAVAGYPHVTVPMGAVGRLPVGLSFVGTAWSEPALLALAYDFEQATLARRAPQFAANNDGA
jgi:amidase